MEDTIEICAGCGKMPRSIDYRDGYFVCSRCGNRATIQVTADEYESVVISLDERFHKKIMRIRHELASKEPVTAPGGNPGPRKSSRTKAAKKKKTKPAKKSKSKKPKKKAKPAKNKPKARKKKKR